jgi:hypothetical protein
VACAGSPGRDASRLPAKAVPKTSAGGERLFSAVKRKLWARAPGRSLETQRVQVLLLGLAYNLYRLKPCSV